MGDTMISERLMQNAEEIGFPLKRYTEQINKDYVFSDFNCLKYIDMYNPVMESEVQEMKEYLNSLKFNYLELFTKERFIQLLQEGPDSWREKAMGEKMNRITSVSEPNDVDKSAEKKDYSQMERKKEATIQQLNGKVFELIDAYDTFRENKKNLLTNIQEAVKMIKSIAPDDQTSAINDPSKDKRQAELSSALADISGMHIISCASNEPLVVQFGNTHKGVVSFDEVSDEITGFELTPNDVPCQDIVEYAITIDSVVFLIKEMKSRIVFYQQRSSEIETLRAKYIISNDASGHHKIEMNNGTVLRVSLSHDYPQSHSRLQVLELTGTIDRPFDELKLQINSAPFLTLTNLLQSMEEIFL
ncbi:hypothetical protein PROFUN_11052 [Planoprotostelium fungivorum]|uniref:Uncharacterized protein n=1 Tax=Planoprotostelium fungivorum TaxID=1890364 RepID=A0A2P6NBN7_9EUKA|nr:hypothetical protein PROFUN_11052 [Planoprotostelium fungivorum]